MSGPAGGGFDVDLASVQQLIKDLTHERRMLEDMRDTAQQMLTIGAPGADPVSESAMGLINRKISVDDNSYVQAVEQLDKQLDDTINKLNDSIRVYQEQDHAGASHFRKHGS